jgi:hypothetical protein
MYAEHIAIATEKGLNRVKYAEQLLLPKKGLNQVKDAENMSAATEKGIKPSYVCRTHGYCYRKKVLIRVKSCRTYSSYYRNRN